MKTMQAVLAAGLVVATFGLAVAKLPAPPPMSDAQKAAAEEAKGKAAAATALAAQQQAAAEDRVASRYFADMKAKGKQVPASQMAVAAPATPPAKDAKAAPKK
jgi:hypothetical protein